MLKKYRTKSGISQSILASELGVSRNMINNLEYGRGRIISCF
ncbi:helix-turn-helix transcriptional regulator [[Clostridium] innocuum]|uniref:XRE family transcriptional regulator n=2 Tax=Clostridium innocuum TaxID=1522 RepID=A0A3E2VUH8_CLOIN|nr:helix-turn-helix domain-containing protein [[Clostridium] innocuum]MCC2851404.1 helix-turn-helix domain-containing protein [[Clostridium] innocuum]MCC2855512.1 helix-turn-helix domain-containing protein [[Clostridium] innocuum]RGC14807.1 XRE family transcriptional regulator [[Clostridium] innocuum]RHV64102.1 XRE family transcriptional regulator [Clostridiaceae bacterium OM02-2AC]